MAKHKAQLYDLKSIISFLYGITSWSLEQEYQEIIGKLGMPKHIEDLKVCVTHWKGNLR